MTDLSALNPQQREAVTAADKRILVLAGAGSGKTKTLLQKIIYLIEEKGVPAAHILAITFTKNAANEMVDRLILSADKSGEYEAVLQNKKTTAQAQEDARRTFRSRYRWIDALTVRTFHSYGYRLLRNYGVHEFDNRFRIVGEDKVREEDEFLRYVAPETVYEVFSKLLIQRCEDRTYLLRLKRYVLDYLVDRIHKHDAPNRPLHPEGKRYTALDGTRVRSKSEQFIADYLFRNSIPYRYEPQVLVRDFPFRPDFYIPDANLYIEHVSNRSHPMQGKEAQFEQGGLLYAKTFEHLAEDSSLFTHTLDRLIRGRLPARFAHERLLSYEEAFKGHLDHLREFLLTVMRVNDMIKVDGLDPQKMLEQAQTDPHERIRAFYALAIPLLHDYAAYCTDHSYLDFNDLIGRTLSLLRNHEDIARRERNQYRYVLVDEFQDVNTLQVELIKQLLSDDTQLFCVGDDWQSIYGFRGSDVQYILDFEKHFPGARLIQLDLNYRSTQHIVGAGNEVIRHNRLRIDKTIRATKMSDHKIVVYAGSSLAENIAFCLRTVRECLDEGLGADDILFLYRRTAMMSPFADALRRHSLRIQTKTIHAAKGLEARVVFIVGLTDGFGGFPDIWLEDRIFQVVKKGNYDLLLEEERRLFYVAITRARDRLFLITEKGRESSFLREIPEAYTVRTGEPMLPTVEEARLCPQCRSRLEPLFAYCPYCGAGAK
ncbi:MAG: UvrD-helicase domain-containing protein [Saprospiraceae bacterium]|nr:UvrD-helicase domain-containing protein [Saprospiraceae bacterium]